MTELSIITPWEQRLTIDRVPGAAASEEFGEAVRTGFTASPKSVSPKWLYDDLGSSLFESICLLPEYELTRTEHRILATNADDILACAGDAETLVELGSGGSTKTRLLIEAALLRRASLLYSPLDISVAALEAAARRLVQNHDRLDVHAYAGDYLALLEGGSLAHGRKLVLFLGSNLGNYEPAAAHRLLAAIASVLEKGDTLLLGLDLVRGTQELENAYDDPTGVTAAFTKNLLGRVNRELGGEFDLRKFRHIAKWDPERRAVDSSLESTQAQTVRINDLNLSLDFAAGERIHVESSYKFQLADLPALGTSVGLHFDRVWTDDRERFAEALYQVG